MTVSGKGQIIRNPSGAGTAQSARFIVDNSQTIGADDTVTVNSWRTPADVADPTTSWDNIGFDPSEYQGTGQFTLLTPANIELVIFVFSLLNPATPTTPGEGFVGINLSSGGLFDEQDFRGLIDSAIPAMNLPAGRRFSSGNGFLIEAHQGGATGTSTIGPMAVYMLRVGTF